MPISLSPSVQVVEKDLSTTIPAVGTNVTGMVGVFTKGPCFQRRLTTTPRDLEDTYGASTDANYTDWYTAYNVLQYNQSLYVVRVCSSDSKNAGIGFGIALFTSATQADYRPNDEDEFTPADWDTSELARFLARYPGEYGNSIKVGVISGTDFVTASIDINGATYSVSNFFDRPTLDAEDFAVLITYPDADGNDAVVEKFIVSTSISKKDQDGNLLYFDEYLSRNSSYIAAFSNTTATFDIYTTASVTALVSGTNGTTAALGDFESGYDLFANPEEFDVNILVDAHPVGASADLVNGVHVYLNSITDSRKDCIAVYSPPRGHVVGKTSDSTATTCLTEYASASLASTSYAAFYGNWKYQFDRYSGRYRWLPISGDVAGIYARTDTLRDPWFAPAGFNRGGVKNTVKFAIKPDKAMRDQLYKYRVNPVLFFPGDGPVVFGQKTLQVKSSAFDRVEVRRLFIYLEKAISTVSRYFLFEKNTAFTRRLIVGIIEPFLRDVKGREGLYDFLVVCDDTNNTGEVIDRNELICDIYLKPTKSAETLTLNFIATKTGVSFTELLNK